MTVPSYVGRSQRIGGAGASSPLPTPCGLQESALRASLRGARALPSPIHREPGLSHVGMSLGARMSLPGLRR